MRFRKKRTAKQTILPLEEPLSVGGKRDRSRSCSGHGSARGHTVIGFDPGKNSGWAVWLGNRYQASGTFHGDDPQAVLDILAQYKPTAAVVEDQYYDKESSIPFERLKRLVIRRGMIEACCKLSGVPVFEVRPNSWIAYAGVAGGDMSAYIRVARSYAGDQSIKTHDQAAAVLIALWGVGNTHA